MKKLITFIITILIVAYTLITSDFSMLETENEIKQVTNIENGEFKIHFIDVGQADSILIESNNEFMLVDAGNNGDGDLVVNYLKEEGVSELKYVIGTHAHEDHIGGMDNVIREFDINRFFMPNVMTTTRTFETVLDELLNKHIKFETPNINDEFNLGDTKIEIIHVSESESNINNTSIVTKVTYKDTSYLLMGDAEEEVEHEINNIQADVLKLGHHGSRSSTNEEFLKMVNPQIAIICAGQNNKYGHPHKETLDKLKNINTYSTMDNGTIVLTSDGQNISVETEK